MSSFTRHSLKLAFLSLTSTTATIQLPLETWNKHEEKSKQAKTLSTKIEHHFYRPINNRQFKGPFFVYTNWTHPDSCKGQAKRFLFLQMPLIWSHLLFSLGKTENIQMRLSILAFVKRLCKHIDIYSTSREAGHTARCLANGMVFIIRLKGRKNMEHLRKNKGKHAQDWNYTLLFF